MKQIPTCETVLQGHLDSVNTLKFNADLTFLLSGGTLFYSSIILTTVLTDCLDNSGFIIIWDLVLRAPFQKIDASCAGSVTSVCWINLLKNVTPGEDDPAFAFAVGFGTGIIAIYRQSSENVSPFGHFFFRTNFFSWLSAHSNSSKTLKPMMGQLRISPSTGTF
jgi:WD40 repeat protein